MRDDTSEVTELRFTIEREVQGSYIGRDTEGASCLIIPTIDLRPPLDRITGDVSLTFRPKGTFSVADVAFSSSAAVVRCENSTMDRTFDVLARDIATSLRVVAERPAPQEVSRALARWERLLRGRRQLSRDDEVGLWGELWTLLELHDVSRGLAAWRGPDAELVDFAGGGIGVECKAGTRRLEHWISQDQVMRPLGDLEVFLLSLWVGTDAVSGATVSELVERAVGRTDDEAALEEKLLSVGYSHADSHRYKIKLLLLEPPMLFPMSSLPRVRVADAGISQIRFLAELDEESALPAAEVVSTLAKLCAS